MMTLIMTNRQIYETRMTSIFNEWAKRYADNPDQFGEILGEDGRPVSDYGELCMHYFCEIAKDMDAAGLLPLPEQTTTLT